MVVSFLALAGRPGLSYHVDQFSGSRPPPRGRGPGAAPCTQRPSLLGPTRPAPRSPAPRAPPRRCPARRGGVGPIARLLGQVREAGAVLLQARRFAGLAP